MHGARLHPTEARHLGPWPAFQNQCKSQEAPDLRAIRAFARCRAQIRRRKIVACDLIAEPMPKLLPANRNAGLANRSSDRLGSLVSQPGLVGL